MKKNPLKKERQKQKKTKKQKKQKNKKTKKQKTKTKKKNFSFFKFKTKKETKNGIKNLEKKLFYNHQSIKVFCHHQMNIIFEEILFFSSFQVSNLVFVFISLYLNY